ncbi:hypothetical protein D8T54_23220, partial [Vibrio vulnificus]
FDKRLPFLVGASFSHFKSPLGRRFDLIIRARRLECGVYDALTLKHLNQRIVKMPRVANPS